MTEFRIGNGLVSTIGMITLATMASAQQFQAEILPTLGGPGAAAYGVNDLGHVVGAADLRGDGFHACIWIDGVAHDLGALADGAVSTAFSVNNSDLVVGRSEDANGTNRAVRWVPDGSGGWDIEDLGTLRDDDTGFGWATRVNNSGQIVGYATASAGSYHAFVWTNGTMADLGTLHWTGPLAYSQGLGINDAGQTVGFAYRVLGGPEHGFFHDGGSQLDITPAGSFALAQGHNINAAGVIGGYVSASSVGDGNFQAAYLPPRGTWQLIPRLPEHIGSFGFDISDAGEMVGISFNEQTPDFRGFYFDGEAVFDLNAITTGQPGQITDAFDISQTGFVAATANSLDGPAALLLSGMSTPCTGDVDGDHDVDLTDLATLLTDFGLVDTGLHGDLDRDGDVDLVDLATLLGNFGVVC
ncbi:MAG: hypothetical protein ACKVS9_10275 [Phycisphaerae bacterium]